MFAAVDEASHTSQRTYRPEGVDVVSEFAKHIRKFVSKRLDIGILQNLLIGNDCNTRAFSFTDSCIQKVIGEIKIFR